MLLRCDLGSLVTMKFTPSMCMCASGKAQAGKEKKHSSGANFGIIPKPECFDHFLGMNLILNHHLR